MSRCLCVFSRILGWRVFGGYVDAQLARYSDRVEFDRLDYDSSAFRYRVPWYLDVSDVARTSYRLNRLIESRGIDAATYDSFIFQGHDLAIPFRQYLGRDVRMIMDATPAIAARRERGKFVPRSILKRVACELQDARIFRPMFSRVAAFLVLSEHVKNSLVNDYGVSDSRIFVAGPPVFDSVRQSSPQEKPDRPVILFVGNDFERKGGRFLLELYSRFYADTADLWIVSNGVDPGLLPPGIRVLSDIPHSEVLDLMRQSSVFVFPSYHDELGLVLAEAACAGLPIVARESGGQSEYVKNDQNGYLMPLDDDSHAWKEAIDSILFDDSTRAKLAANSRELGRRLCTQERFDRQFAAFLGQPPP